MATRAKGWCLYMKAYWRTYATVVALPLAFYTVLFIVGMNTGIVERTALIETVIHVGKTAVAGILALAAIVVGAITTNRIVREDREESERLFGQEKEELIKKHNEEMTRAENNWYSVNPVACIERAHRVFCRLYKEGENLRNSTATVRQAWDRKVIQALKENTIDACILNYHVDTNRPNYQTENEPLQDDLFPQAMEHLENILNERFSYYKTTWAGGVR